MGYPKRKLKPFRAWIAVSEQGHCAFFLGLHPTRMMLKESYAVRFNMSFDQAGYRAQRVTVKADEQRSIL